MFACEKEDRVQLFLEANSSELEAIIPDTKFLKDEVAPTCLRGGGQIHLGPVDLYAAGFICKARSKQNSNRSGPATVRSEKESTGTSWAEIKGYIESHQPKSVILENIVQWAPRLTSMGRLCESSSYQENPLCQVLWLLAPPKHLILSGGCDQA